ncbi:F5/8 type C domain containing protein [Histomonas meleagridis]|uniref:F5/8 type C domain containing protein n=1 Tax=Histomonas meleagridis TaxID=135588 RepID=UPI00355A8376|nr:F5/8 type C domain containing protein [Histomonas meleagridis]KAH0799341.1 F5/8 type C domain containing protein [Histomonas meleagridis]
MKVSTEHLGFAIIDFPTTEAQELALSYSDELPFKVVKPNDNLLDLRTEDYLPCSIDFQPPPSNALYETDLYETFLNLELIHCETPYKVNNFLASIYSSKIQQLQLSNPLLSRVEIKIDIQGPFDLIASALLGQKIEIDSENAHFLFLMASYLGMDELVYACSIPLSLQLDDDSSLSLYNELSKYGIELSEGPHINYLAQNIDNMIFNESFTSLPIQLIASVLHCPTLHTEDINQLNEWLYEFVYNDILNRDRLLQFIDFECAPKKSAYTVVRDERVNTNLVRHPILKLMAKGTDVSKGEYEIIQCHYTKENPNFGIFAHLCAHCSGNPQDFNFINVTSNTIVQNILNPDFNNYWASPDIPNSWLCIDFKEFEIIPTGYVIKTLVSDVKLPFLTSWRLEGSLDGHSFETLDEKRNATASSEKRELPPTPINPSKNRYRFIRITHIDKNGYGNFCMYIRGIEFFGRIIKFNEDIEYTKQGNEWNGIIARITRLVQGNPVEKGKMEITTSSDPKYLVESNWEGCWRSPKVPNSYVKIDMMAMKVKFDRYALKTHYGRAFIKSWKVEVSNDDRRYITVADVKNSDKYTEPLQTLVWDVDKQKMTEPFRFVKITMTDSSQNKNDYIFWLSHIELYGDLYRPL